MLCLPRLPVNAEHTLRTRPIGTECRPHNLGACGRLRTVNATGACGRFRNAQKREPFFANGFAKYKIKHDT